MLAIIMTRSHVRFLLNPSENLLLKKMKGMQESVMTNDQHYTIGPFVRGF